MKQTVPLLLFATLAIGTTECEPRQLPIVDHRFDKPGTYEAGQDDDPYLIFLETIEEITDVMDSRCGHLRVVPPARPNEVLPCVRHVMLEFATIADDPYFQELIRRTFPAPEPNSDFSGYYDDHNVAIEHTNNAILFFLYLEPTDCIGTSGARLVRTLDGDRLWIPQWSVSDALTCETFRICADDPGHPGICDLEGWMLAGG